jgi:DNA-binding protein HU-beta
MNKSELIAEIANITGFTKTDSAKAVDAFTQAVQDALTSADEVRLVGFGTFTVVKRQATEGRNPRTGAPIKIPASNQPKFKPGKELKEAVNSPAAKKKKAA